MPPPLPAARTMPNQNGGAGRSYRAISIWRYRATYYVFKEEKAAYESCTTVQR